MVKKEAGFWLYFRTFLPSQMYLFLLAKHVETVLTQETTRPTTEPQETIESKNSIYTHIYMYLSFLASYLGVKYIKSRNET